jgi:hypothetical protein
MVLGCPASPKIGFSLRLKIGFKIGITVFEHQIRILRIKKKPENILHARLKEVL